jgi:hypothetical protein
VFAVAVTLGMLVPSAVGQAAHRREAEEVADARVIPHVHFASMAAGRLTPERIASAHAEDPVVEATLRRMEGFRLGAEVRGGRALEEAAAAAPGAAALEGIGQALVDGQGWRDLPGWYPRWAALPAGQARSIARGAAWNLGIALELGGPRRVGAAAVADALRLSRQGVPEGQPCAVCAAAGYAAMKACRGEGASCLVEVSEGPDAAEVLYGAGVACPTAGTVDPRCDRIASELPAALAAAFTAGMRDPMAGADAPVRITAR